MFPFNNFVYGNSIIHKLDPRVKMFFVLVYVTVILMASTFTEYIYLFLIIFIPIYLAKIPQQNFWKGLKAFMLLFAFTLLFHLFLTPGKVIFSFSHLTATYEGLRNGTIFTTRLFLMIISASFFTFTSAPFEIAAGIESILKPFKRFSIIFSEIPMMISIALRFIPTLIQEGERIIFAQRARGAQIRRGKHLIPIIYPIIFSSLRRADQLAFALKARGYSPERERTKLHPLKIKSIDIIFIFYSFLPLLTLMGVSH